MTQNSRHSSPVEHGFPHLETVRAAITALFRRLSPDGIRAYDTSFAPADAAFGADEDLHLGAHRVASAMVRALRLPDARMVVAFRPMRDAASVELAAGPEYFVEVSDRFRTHRRDLAAALAHEVTHVLLHRLGLGFPTTAENEILTDTAAAYLGAGFGCCSTPTARTRSPTRSSATSPRRSSATSWHGAPACSARTPPPGSPARRRTRPTCAAAPGRAGAAPGPARGRRTAGAAPVREGTAHRGAPGGRVGVPLRGGRRRSGAAGELPLSGVRAATAGRGARAAPGAVRAVPHGAGVRHVGAFPAIRRSPSTAIRRSPSPPIHHNPLRFTKIHGDSSSSHEKFPTSQ